MAPHRQTPELEDLSPAVFSFLEAGLAVHGSVPAGFERHLALLFAVGAYGFVHLPRSPAEPSASTEPTSLTLKYHVYPLSIDVLGTSPDASRASVALP